MVKIYREFFSNGNIKKEIYYYSETGIVSEIKSYNLDGVLFLCTNEEGMTLETAIKEDDKVKKEPPDALYIAQEAFRTEMSRIEIEVSIRRREIEERRVAEEAAKTRLAERYTGRTLKNGELY
jgi:hypothetical protein